MPTWDELLKETEEYQPLALFDKYVQKLAEATSHTIICICLLLQLQNRRFPLLLFPLWIKIWKDL